jgi:hypothetical protein
MKFYNIKMRNGDVHFINEKQHTAIKRVLAQNFRDRREFFDLDEDTTIKVDQISSITLDKD